MIRLLASLAIAVGVTSCGANENGSARGDGGSEASDAANASGGNDTGGMVSSSGGSGAMPTGGTASGGAGGVSQTGGAAGSGGAVNTGGTMSTGGSVSTGGTTADGSVGTCGSISTFEDGRVPTSEIHVAATGDDLSGDGTSQNPYATIDRAANGAMPGVAIQVHAGTYMGGAYIQNLAGTADAPIWIGGAPGEARPLIDGGGEAIHFVGARYVVVHDLEVANQTGNGINADDGDDRANIDASRYVIFRNLSIHDIGTGGNQDCLKLSGINDYFVLDSEFARCGGGDSGSGIDHVGCHSGLIARNTFSALTGGGNAVQCKGGSEAIEIRNNLITDGGQRGVNMGGSTGFDFFRPPLSTTSPNAEARDIRVVANVIVRSYASLAFVGCVDCLAANNTIVDPENWILRILQETTTGSGYTFLEAQNGRFVNNLIYFARGGISTYVNVGAGTLPDTFTFANNLWYAYDDPSQSTPTDLPGPESAGIYGEDPLFADFAGGDYAITAISPAAHTGTAIPELTTDMTGTCFADPPSIGAFEAP